MRMYVWRNNYKAVDFDDREAVVVMTDQGLEHARMLAKAGYLEEMEFEADFLDEAPEIYEAEKVVLL